MESEQQLVCRKATDVLTVFLVNYFTHSYHRPDLSGPFAHCSRGRGVVVALLVPYKGIYAALRIIAR